MNPEDANKELAIILAGMLSGKLTLGFTVIAKLVPAIQAAKGDGWVSQGLSEWAGTDPDASTKLARIFQGVGNRAPVPFKGALLTWLKTDPNALMLLLGAIQQLQVNPEQAAAQEPV